MAWSKAEAAKAFGLTLCLSLAGCGGSSDPAEAVSVLLVTLDTTRADRLGCYGHENAGTARLDALAARGTLFERAYTVAPITLPAHGSIFTGTYPVWHGIRDNGSFQLDERLETLAETFAANGWRTGAFVAAYPVARGFGLEQGFETYDDDFGHEREDRRFSRAERRAEDVIADATSWLAGLPRTDRFLAWVHLFDPHAIHEPPAPFDTLYADDLYQGEIAYTDQALGALFDWLDRTGRADSTIVVVVADHGEGLGDHGEETHGALIYDTTMHVPLILAGPGIPVDLRDPRVVRLIDILPTLTQLAGLETPAAVQGRSLVGAWRGRDEGPRTAYLETLWPRLQHGWSEMRGVVSGDWKLIEAPDVGDQGPELYNVRTDPGEQNDLARTERDRGQELARLVEDEAAEYAAEDDFDSARGLSAEDEAKLRALGYIGGTSDDPQHFDRHPRDMVRLLYGYVLVANHLRDGLLPEALKVLDEIETLDPDGLGLHEHRGMVYQDMGRRGDPQGYPLAIESFRKALAINGRREDIWMNLGEIYRGRGEYQEAITCYERSMDIATPSRDVEVNYAGMLASVGRLDEAIASLETLLDRDADFARGHLTLGMLLAASGRNDEALAEFETTVAAAGPGDPERLTAHKSAGALALQLGRRDAALRHLEAAEGLAPDDAEVRQALARLRAPAAD